MKKRRPLLAMTKTTKLQQRMFLSVPSARIAAKNSGNLIRLVIFSELSEWIFLSKKYRPNELTPRNFVFASIQGNLMNAANLLFFERATKLMTAEIMNNRRTIMTRDQIELLSKINSEIRTRGAKEISDLSEECQQDITDTVDSFFISKGLREVHSFLMNFVTAGFKKDYQWPE